MVSPQIYAVLLGGDDGKPVIDIDFLTPPYTDFLTNMTFIRTTNATEVNIAGNIEWAPANEVERSSFMATGPWANLGSATTGTAILDEFDVKETAVTSQHYTTQPIANLTIGQPYEIQATVKGGLTRGFAILAADTTGIAITVNLTTGAVSTAQGTPIGAYTVTDETVGGNTWYTVGFHFVATATTENWKLFISTDGVYGNLSYAGNTADGITVRHCQFCIYESQRTPAPYNATDNSGNKYFAPRFVYDATTHAALGLLVEDTRTNLLTSAFYDGSDLISSQVVSTSNQTYGISLSGTGTITITGAATSSIVGPGAWPARSFTTFVSAGGNITVAATPGVVYAQLEAGSSPTSFIPTTLGVTATRAHDDATIPATIFVPTFNAIAGTYLVNIITGNKSAPQILAMNPNTLFPIYFDASWHARTNNGSNILLTSNAVSTSTAARVAFSYTSNSRAICMNGGAVATDANHPFLTVPTSLSVGEGSAQYMNGTISRFRYYNTSMTNAQLQALTA